MIQVSSYFLDYSQLCTHNWVKTFLMYTSGQVRKKGGFVWIVLLQRSRPAYSLAWVRKDVLQPVKGIELSEEDRGETAPNMGSDHASWTPPQHTHTELRYIASAAGRNSSAPEVVKRQNESSWPNFYSVFPQCSINDARQMSQHSKNAEGFSW